MKRQRSRTAGVFFPIPQLMRTGHTGAAFAWMGGSLLSIVAFLVGIVVAANGGGGGGVALILAGLAGLAFCAVGETIHARRLVKAWNDKAEAEDFERQVRVATEAARRTAAE